MLQARVEGEIIALRKVETPPGLRAPKPGGAIQDGRVLRSVLTAVAQSGVGGEAGEALERTRERLTETEDFDALLALPFRDCVATICADLGLDPDWSQWSNEVGFVAEAANPPLPQPQRLPDGGIPAPRAFRFETSVLAYAGTSPSPPPPSVSHRTSPGDDEPVTGSAFYCGYHSRTTTRRQGSR